MNVPTPRRHSYPRRWVVPAIAVSVAAALSAGLMARTLRSYSGPVARTATPDARAAVPSPPLPVVLQFSLVAHSRAGTMDAAKATQTRQLAPTEQAAVAFQVGEPTRPEFCAVGTRTPGEAPSGFLGWGADATVTAVDGERVDFVVAWHRLAADGTRVAGATQSISLRDGQTHLLDIVAAPPAASSRCHYAALQVQATLGPPLPDALLAHRLWLVVDHDGQRLVAGPADVLGAPGEPVPFRLHPLVWPLASADRRPEAPSVTLEVQGRLTATLSPTGTVDARVQVTRRLHVGGWLEGTGTMPIRAPLGTAVTIGLPTPTSRDRLPGVPLELLPSPPRGVTWSGGEWQVAFEEYFAGSAVTLVVQTDRVR